VTRAAPSFILRMQLQSRLRAALQNRGYQEAVTPVLQPAPGPDPEIEPIIAPYAPLMEPDPPGREMYLHTSPEFAMKRLLCRGLGAIYQIGPVFRQGESGPLHSPEFTMAEWYRAGWTYRELMQEVEAVIAQTLGDRVTVGGKDIHLTPPLPRVSVAEAMKEAGVDPGPWRGTGPGEWLDRFHDAFVARVEPWLAGKGAVFLTDFPAPAALLGKMKDDDPFTAERFELIIAGVEIANGCTELTDPAEHRLRFQAEQELRRRRGKKVFPLPEAFLHDLDSLGLPPCAGVALGVDRLAMIAAGAGRIEQVQAFGFAE